MPLRASFALLLAVALLAAPGCFKSSTSQASSESSSDSSGSSSRSSASSSGSSRDSVYESDVADYTKQWALSGGDVESFRSGLGPIAEKDGITDWENDENTYEGIGAGLKKSGVKGQRFEQLKGTLAGSNPKSPDWIQSGYDGASAD